MNCYYDINRASQIVEVGGDWDKFAKANDGVYASEVVGTSLFAHISGDLTKLLFEMWINKAFSLEESFRRKYRCDAPGKRRVFEMRAFRINQSALRLSHELLWERLTGPHVHFDTVPISDVARCSICNSFRYRSAWHDAHDLSDHGTIETHYTVCPDCIHETRKFIA